VFMISEIKNTSTTESLCRFEMICSACSNRVSNSIRGLNI
jgi:hypothetical protein